MAPSKDERTNRLRALRRQHLRKARRAALRKYAALARGRKDDAARAQNVREKHKKLAQEDLHMIRERRAVSRRPKPITTGTVTRDGVEVPSWLAPFIDHARGNGWQGRVVSGVRSLAQAWFLWNNAARLGLVHFVSVAFPGTSNHIGFVWPKGAIDVTDFEKFAELEHGRTIDGKTLRAYSRVVGSHDPVHFSSTGH